MNKTDMAAPMTVHQYCFVLFSFISMEFIKPLPMVIFRGKLTSIWMYLTDQTLMREACVFVLWSQLF